MVVFLCLKIFLPYPTILLQQGKRCLTNGKKCSLIEQIKKLFMLLPTYLETPIPVVQESKLPPTQSTEDFVKNVANQRKIAQVENEVHFLPGFAEARYSNAVDIEGTEFYDRNSQNEVLKIADVEVDFENGNTIQFGSGFVRFGTGGMVFDQGKGVLIIMPDVNDRLRNPENNICYVKLNNEFINNYLNSLSKAYYGLLTQGDKNYLSGFFNFHIQTCREKDYRINS